MKYLAANEALNDLYANTEYELAYDGAKSMLLLDNYIVGIQVKY